VTRRFLTVTLTAALLIGACGGGSGEEGATTTGGEDTPTTIGGAGTTEIPNTTSDGEGRPIGLEDIPQVCIDAFVEYLQALEPIVADIDWSTASMTDLEEVGNATEEATNNFETATESAQCADMNIQATDEETFEYILDLARDTAPGTVGYFEMLRDFVGNSDAEVSGDCETDIAALMAIIDQGGTMKDLPMADLTMVGNLTTSITTNCSQDRAAEFLSESDVLAWMSG